MRETDEKKIESLKQQNLMAIASVLANPVLGGGAIAFLAALLGVDKRKTSSFDKLNQLQGGSFDETAADVRKVREKSIRIFNAVQPQAFQRKNLGLNLTEPKIEVEKPASAKRKRHQQGSDEKTVAWEPPRTILVLVLNYLFLREKTVLACIDKSWHRAVQLSEINELVIPFSFYQSSAGQKRRHYLILENLPNIKKVCELRILLTLTTLDLIYNKEWIKPMCYMKFEKPLFFFDIENADLRQQIVLLEQKKTELHQKMPSYVSLSMRHSYSWENIQEKISQCEDLIRTVQTQIDEARNSLNKHTVELDASLKRYAYSEQDFKKLKDSKIVKYCQMLKSCLPTTTTAGENGLNLIR
jgi:hypothetical protein